MENFINIQQLQNAISGRDCIRNAQCISELKEKYGHERIAGQIESGFEKCVKPRPSGCGFLSSKKDSYFNKEDNL